MLRITREPCKMEKLNLICTCLLVVWAAQAGQALVEDALVTEKVYLDLEVEGSLAERIIIGLFGATSPKTVRNFVALANHEVSCDSWQRLCCVCAEQNFQTILIARFRKAMVTKAPYFTESFPTS